MLFVGYHHELVVLIPADRHRVQHILHDPKGQVLIGLDERLVGGQLTHVHALEKLVLLLKLPLQRLLQGNKSAVVGSDVF